MWPTHEAYAEHCSEILGRPVDAIEVACYLDELNEEVLQMIYVIENGLTTRTLH